MTTTPSTGPAAPSAAGPGALVTAFPADWPTVVIVAGYLADNPPTAGGVAAWVDEVTWVLNQVRIHGRDRA